MLDILFGPERSSARVTPPSRHAVYQTVDGRLYARAGDIKEEATQEVTEEVARLKLSLDTLREAILAHRQAKHLRYDTEDVTLWSHVSE